MKRVFKYNDQVWEDPGEGFSNEDVRTHLTQFFPELAQASIEEKKLDDETTEVRFVKRAGTKGAAICSLHGANAGVCQGEMYQIGDPALGYEYRCERHIKLISEWMRLKTGKVFTDWYQGLSETDIQAAEMRGVVDTLVWEPVDFPAYEWSAAVSAELAVQIRGGVVIVCTSNPEMWAILGDDADQQGIKVSVTEISNLIGALSAAYTYMLERAGSERA